MKEIINRVAQSNLMTIDLEDYYPKGKRLVFDIKQWLFQELILKEKDFREQVKNHDWSQYQGAYVALSCSSDAIVPSWAYLLLAVHLEPYACKVVYGDLQQLETVVFQDIIRQLNIEPFQNKPVIIKGCANKPIPQTAYLQLIEKLKPVAKTIMYGEACSTVPLFKAKK